MVKQCFWNKVFFYTSFSFFRISAAKRRERSVSINYAKLARKVTGNQYLLEIFSVKASFWKFPFSPSKTRNSKIYIGTLSNSRRSTIKDEASSSRKKHHHHHHRSNDDRNKKKPKDVTPTTSLRRRHRNSKNKIIPSTMTASTYCSSLTVILPPPPKGPCNMTSSQKSKWVVNRYIDFKSGWLDDAWRNLWTSPCWLR